MRASQLIPDAVIAKKRLVLVGAGSTRIAYATRSGRYVVKIPVNGFGVLANVQEARDFRVNPHKHKGDMARCRLIRLGDEPCCLMMERVTPVDRDIAMPDWVWKVDNGQIGFTRRGKLVAYDWSLWFERGG